MTNQEKTTYLGFSGNPSRAVSLEIPLAELNHTAAPAHSTITLELNPNNPDECTAYLTRFGAFHPEEVTARSVSFPTAMLVDLYNQLPNPDPVTDVELEEMDIDIEQGLSAEELVQWRKQEFERLLRIATDATEELYKVRAAVEHASWGDEFEKALESAVDERIKHRAEQDAAIESALPPTF